MSGKMKRCDHQSIGWDTDAECAWLDVIGQADQGALAVPRRDRLRGYLVGAASRSCWGRIDRRLAIRHAEALLLESVLAAEVTPPPESPA